MVQKSLLILALIMTLLPSAVFANVVTGYGTNTSAVMRDISRQSNIMTGNMLRSLERYNQPVIPYYSRYYDIYGFEDPVSRSITRTENVRRGINDTISNIRQDTANLLNK